MNTTRIYLISTLFGFAVCLIACTGSMQSQQSTQSIGNQNSPPPSQSFSGGSPGWSINGVMDTFGITWKPLRLGAGGWLIGMDIVTDGTMVVRTDTYGAYVWN